MTLKLCHYDKVLNIIKLIHSSEDFLFLFLTKIVSLYNDFDTFMTYQNCITTKMTRQIKSSFYNTTYLFLKLKNNVSYFYNIAKKIALVVHKPPIVIIGLTFPFMSR